MKIATDLDNTLGFIPELPKELRKRFLTGDNRRLKIQLYREYRQNAEPNKVLIKELEGQEFFIITSRRPSWEKMTCDWLEKHGIKPTGIFFFDGEKKSRETIIEYKAKILNRLMLDVYYEDDLVIAENLQKLCPKTKISNPPK